MAKKAIKTIANKAGNKAADRARTSTKNVIIGWSEAQSATNFKKALKDIFLAIPGLTDSRHIKYLTSKSEVDEAVYSGSCDILFLSENVNGTPIGKGEIRKYLANGAEGINVILVISDDKRGAGKLKGLYGYGYYNAIYKKDCYPDYIGNLVKHPRSAPDAYDYYGLADYVDPLDSTGVPMPQELREVVEMPVPVKEDGGDRDKAPSKEPTAEAAWDDTGSDTEETREKGGKGNGDGKSDKGSKDSKDKRVKADAKERKSKRDNNADVDTDTDAVADADTGASFDGKTRAKDKAVEKDGWKEKGKGRAVSPEKELDGSVNKEPAEDREETSVEMPKEGAEGLEDAESIEDIENAESASAETGEEIASEGPLEESSIGAQSDDGLSDDGGKLSDKLGRSEQSGQSEPPEQPKEPEQAPEPIKFPQEIEQAGGWLSDWTDEEVQAYLSSCDLELKQKRVNAATLSETDHVTEALLRHYTKEETRVIKNLENNLMSRTDFERNLTTYMTRTFKADKVVMADAYRSFLEFMFGYDVITPLIEDSMVSDIKIYEPDNVRVKRHGKRQEAEVKFRSPEHYRAFVSHIAKKNHVSISKGDNIVHFTDTTSFKDFRMRINISTEFVNSDNYPCVHIRKINNQKYTTQQLVDAKMLSYRTAAYLIDKAQNDSGIIFTGKGSAGKTTCMNWLIDYIPRDCSALCIQESDELFSSSHPDILFQRIADDKESQNTYDLKTLAINGLLTDIDYFIIGEIKGAEAKYFLNASYTGNRCWASVHSPSSQDALNKIADYATYESDYTKNELLPMLTSLKVVVFLKDFRIVEISEVEGWDEKNKCLRYKRVPLD